MLGAIQRFWQWLTSDHIRQLSAARIQFLSIATLIVLGLGMVLVLTATERSFLVEARTGRIDLTFGQGPNGWRLPNAVLCRPVAIPRRSAADVCGTAAEPEGSSREWLIDWAENDKVSLRSEPDGTLVITSGSGTRDIPAGGRLIVSPSIWDEAGTLLFQAKATIGADLASGTRSYLWSGRWEAREAGSAMFLFRSEAEVVKSGKLASGTKINVVQADGSAALSFGHIARRSDDGPMDVAMVLQFAEYRSFGAVLRRRTGGSRPA